MGMAAGQARLLSITSRMSDNELRAQVINNNKMRLATQSSQVSEAYVNALNEAQMMFTNYDADNKASYQPLTYNALTSYNPYNNQYILTNASGNVLLSEADAVKYKNANGDLEKFLKSYGLKRTTSYFDKLATHFQTNPDDTNIKGIPYKTGTYDEKGMEKLGYITVPGNADADGVGIANYIKALYEGTVDDDTAKLHPGYMAAVSSEEYYNYTKLLADYQTKQDEYLGCVAQLMTDKLKAMKSGGTTGGKTLDEISAGLKDGTGTGTGTTSDLSINKNLLNDLYNFVKKPDGEARQYATTDATKVGGYFDQLAELVNANKGEQIISDITHDDYTLTYTTSGTLELNSPEGLTYTFTTSGVTAKDSAGFAVGSPQFSGSLKPITSGTTRTSYEYEITEDGETYTISIPVACFEGKGNDGQQLTTTGDTCNWGITEQTANTAESMKSTAEAVISSLQEAIYSVWNPSKFEPAPGEYGYDEWTKYTTAAEALSNEIFGEIAKNITKDYYTNLEDIEWTKDVFYGRETFTISNGSTNTNYSPDTTKKNNFEKIYDVYLLDCVMNTYGEPKYAWVDEKNPDENGETKAQWYENLFNRIQSGGYKVLQDGLASSAEWIQFAFESGIVTMEQVDANKNWQPLIYSNCADITEQTNDTAVAKAEAEYKTAMNKIENKDKRYDMELKNIDTEHNSLQTEYESIKSAIDKNIERTFKLYS